MTRAELIDALHDVQEQLEERGDPALDHAILQISDAIESLENSVLAGINAKLAANEADLDAGIAALKNDLKELGKIVDVINDVGSIAKVVAKLI